MITRKEAAEELGSVLAKIREIGYVTPTGKITVAEWLDQWLASLRLAPSTRGSYAKNIRLHLKPKLGHVQLSRLTGSQISALYRDLERAGRQDHKKGSPLSARTVRYVHTILKAALAEAVIQGLLATNPAEKAKPPSAKEARPPEWCAGPLSSCQRFSAGPISTAVPTAQRGGYWPPPGCAGVRLSRCAGATWTWMPAGSACVARSGWSRPRARASSCSRGRPKASGRELLILTRKRLRHCAATG